MIRRRFIGALLCWIALVIALSFALGGCIEVLPVVDPHTDSVSCCLAVAEINRTTDATLQITNTAANLQVKFGVRAKF